MSNVVLGPMLRYVGERDATVWVETDAPATVEVLGHEATTFEVDGHHYALVVVGDLEPGAVHEYDVRLNGARMWPRDDGFPPPVVRTRKAESRTRLAFGSCRAAAPHEPPWTLSRGQDARGREVDALAAYARRMQRAPYEDWPDALLLLGDQVYADDASPRTRSYIRSRRDTSRPPGEEVADFEEYTCLYREAWDEPVIRWLLSTVPVAMIFDDHDIIDDWNMSATWITDMRSNDWWETRIVDGLVAYWVYQHVGNLHPAALEADETFAAVRGADGNAAGVLRDFARTADRDSSSARWSFEREFADARLLVVDSRAGRVLDEESREMLDESEWNWIDERITGDVNHLLIASSLPWLLAPGIHAVETWNEAVCAGAWGSVAARGAEALRRAVDLEHWAAFRTSFERLGGMIRSAASGERGEAPASVLVLSGDVHHVYVAEADFHDPGVTSPVMQIVASPMRQAVEPSVQRAYAVAVSGAGTAMGRALARSAGVPPPSFDWRLTDGPWFDNQVATLEMSGRSARVRIEAVRGGRGADEEPDLRVVLERGLV